jgi:tetratricopeptide (TPR) repeat protein
MVFELKLERAVARLGLLALSLAACALLIYLIFSNFVTGLLADDRARVDSGTLTSAVARFPGSARLHAKLAEAEVAGSNRDLAKAASHASRAVQLSPNDYKNYLLLATVQEMRGDRAAAEESLRQAVRLAPNYTSTRWRLANLLLREGKAREALDEFNKAALSDRRYLPAALDLIWSASRGSVSAVRQVAAGDARAELALAQFLLRQSRLDEAVDIFKSADKGARLASPDTPGFLDSLIEKGLAVEARDIWLDLVGDDRDPSPVWNPGFERNLVKSFPQFDWAIAQSDYAKPGFDRSTARTGASSLKIEFTGRDTTRLDREVRQMVPLRARARYSLEVYVKTKDLVTPDGPRVVVSGKSDEEIATSAPISAGTNDWQRVAFEFTAPPDGLIYISIKRKPRFSYDDPTLGVIWIDDFDIRAL